MDHQNSILHIFMDFGLDGLTNKVQLINQNKVSVNYNNVKTTGKKRIRIFGWNSQWDYSGELDKDGKPSGRGIAINVKDSTWKIRGTFFNG